MAINPKPPDVPRAAAMLIESEQRVHAMKSALKQRNKVEAKFAAWREMQILQFLRYIYLYSSELQPARDNGRLDLVAQAMRNLTELCIWIEFCSLSETNAKQFHEDAARDMRDMMEAVQAVYEISTKFRNRNSPP